VNTPGPIRLSAVAKLYKARWMIELFFKWIKQHLRIKAFLGTTPNAVKTQIWIAISTYLLVAILKKRLRIELPLYTILQILSVSLFEKGGEPHFLNHFEGYFGLSPCRGSRPFSFKYLAGGMLSREACRRMSL